MASEPSSDRAACAINLCILSGFHAVVCNRLQHCKRHFGLFFPLILRLKKDNVSNWSKSVLFSSLASNFGLNLRQDGALAVSLPRQLLICKRVWMVKRSDAVVITHQKNTLWLWLTLITASNECTTSFIIAYYIIIIIISYLFFSFPWAGPRYQIVFWVYGGLRLVIFQGWDQINITVILLRFIPFSTFQH